MMRTTDTSGSVSSLRFGVLAICSILQLSFVMLSHHKIVINKGERMLYVYRNDSLIRSYKVALGFSPNGTKLKQGDGKTPEGTYYISSKNPQSQFYLGFRVSYPNAQDAERGLRSGIISQREFQDIKRANGAHRAPPQNTALGGDICIHGSGTSRNWTWGCIALEDSDIKTLFDEIPSGTPVTINP